MMRRALTLLLLLFALQATAVENVERGRAVYDKWCWWCHGQDGAGDGPAAAYLRPKPRDFTLGIYQFKTTKGDTPPSDADIMRAITAGLPGTAMPAWKDLINEQQRHDLVKLLKTFSDIFEYEKPGPVVSTAGEPPATPERIDAGKKVFRKAKCYECHGDTGKGEPSKRLKDDWGDQIWPRNLTKPWTFRGGKSVRDVFTRVTLGIPGTPMPVFGDPGKKEALEEKERWEVAHYVASLAEPALRPDPGENVIRGVHIEGALPAAPAAAAWLEAPPATFRLAPQIIANERFFTPLNDAITARALYNDAEIALLIQWDDRTPSRPGDRGQAKLVSGKLYEDAVAAQFPATPLAGLEKPYFGHGDASHPVVVWYWAAGAAGEEQRSATFEMKGVGSRNGGSADEPGFSARGEFNAGTWRVVFRHRRQPAGDGVRFESGSFVPVAFANWDGSNGEAASKHTLTRWVWLWLAPQASLKVVYVPVGVALMLGGGLFWLSARVRQVRAEKGG
jgi:DMSO reductase family type II enzyme heme b subunit